jgi:hypothetical protein
VENIRKDLRKGMTIIILIKESLKATSVKSVQKNQVNLICFISITRLYRNFLFWRQMVWEGKNMSVPGKLASASWAIQPE